MRILVVEDEAKVARALQEGLEREEYDVVVARTGEDGFYLVNTEEFDLVILDLMLPGRDGLQVLSTLRKRGMVTPVLILTARDAIEDRVQGLDSGADDYLVKPFAFPELSAGIRALLRRGRNEHVQRLKLADLFSLDAFGGGFLTDALVAYWFFRRFGIAEQGLGIVFFVVHLLNAGSHLVAAWLARHIGLVNTMIFTHLPSSLFLMAVPFAPSFKWAVILFLCREALVEMDVPTRQSYLAALVKPSERTFASGITNLARNVFWAVGSGVAGIIMQLFTFSAPLVIGGGMKVTYDLALYRVFRKLHPPEELERHAT